MLPDIAPKQKGGFFTDLIKSLKMEQFPLCQQAIKNIEELGRKIYEEDLFKGG
jgi:hypothetical protein